MAFMQPVYTCEDFVRFEDALGETHCFPRDVLSDEQIRRDYTLAKDLEIETITGKWWARLSAAGYLDATDWSGPFLTEAEARSEIERIYDIDPDTGEEMSE